METILSIAGKPGLYKLVSRGKMNLIVEALDETHKRQPVFATDRVTSLGDIAMYTDADDIPLWQVLENVGKKENSKESSVNYKKASSKELRAYFTEVLPNWDQDRVHDSDIKKLLQWYNILVKAGITNFKESLAPTEGDNIDDRAEASE
jgi:dephospho-CoA kinase